MQSGGSIGFASPMHSAGSSGFAAMSAHDGGTSAFGTLSAIPTGNSWGSGSGNVRQFSSGGSYSVLSNFTSLYDTSASYKLGHGRHSDVIKARSKTDSRDVAVKVLSINSLGESKVREEVSAMAAFSHKYCAHMVDACQCNERLPNVSGSPPYVCIVMNEIYGAEVLSSRIRNIGPSSALAERVVLHIANALMEMHRVGLVHRDIWTENILVDSTGMSYLIDFGCAAFFRSGGSSSSSQDKPLLNLPYLSPQASNRDPPATGDDMWALGLVLTEVVTGKFISSRMGCHNVPISMKGDCLQAALDETAAMSPRLGAIARRLLDNSAATRASPSEVLSSLGSGGLSNTFNYSSNTDTTYGTVFKGYSGSGTTGSGTGFGFSIGQEVNYEARSHKKTHRATIIGRLASNNGWLLKLERGGTKEVSDADSWRLSPASTSTQGATTASSRSVASVTGASATGGTTVKSSFTSFAAPTGIAASTTTKSSTISSTISAGSVGTPMASTKTFVGNSSGTYNTKGTYSTTMKTQSFQKGVVVR
jgi:serine/threonine protein kinase